MRLIIPMAGRGTRLRPHTHVTPKPLLPVAGKMIVERIIETFHKTLDRTIDEIVFVLGDFGDEVKRELTEMSERQGATARFYTQDVAKGTAHAVQCASDSLEGEVIIVFADTLFDTDTKVTVGDADSVIWLKEVEDPSRFGVAVHEGDTITDFVEKPSEPISNLAIIGVYYFKEGEALKKEIQYLLDNNVTGHGEEYQLTDALDRLLKDGKRFKKATVDEWLDCGTLPAWVETSHHIIEKEQQEIDKSKFPGCTFKEPVYIGKNVTIKDSILGPNVTVNDGATIAGCTLSDTIVLDNATVKNSQLKNSTVGEHAKVKGINGTVHAGNHSVVEHE